jgi:hypothetical protein
MPERRGETDPIQMLRLTRLAPYWLPHVIPEAHVIPQASGIHVDSHLRGNDGKKIF